MNQPVPRRILQGGGTPPALPDGVSAADWALERIQTQNPRIRAFLGCIEMLDGVLDSNYAILHCSPDRLLEIWHQVRQVADTTRTQLGPLLTTPSRVPRLEEARANAEASLRVIAGTVLDDLDRYPRILPPEWLLEVRKLLCVSIGKIYAFLQDCLGEILASDPRSSRDADYYLSRRFHRDIEEAEWLYASVDRLHDYLQTFADSRLTLLEELAERIRREHLIPSGQRWREARSFLELLVHRVTPKLREILALRGIRFDEMEALERYAFDFSTKGRLALALQSAGRQAVAKIKATGGRSRPEREQAVLDLLHCHAVFGAHIAGLLSDVNGSFCDLVAFVPLWQRNIERRRALLLARPS